MNENIEDLANALVDAIRSCSSVVVAFSGGVDSAVIAAAAHRALPDRSVAITGVGSAVSESDLLSARTVAAAIGIPHHEIPTLEIQDENYVRNDSKRCYFCKTNLYRTLRAWADANQYRSLLSGTNQDDLGDYRPGLEAANAYSVIAPLVQLSVTKMRVRKLAQHFQLDVADKPASPCLASRIAYGQSVTTEKLRTIEQAERFLATLGFFDVRVRHHADDLVRLELSLSDLQLACDPTTRQAIVDRMNKLGYKFVTLDLMGRNSGSLNRVLPIVTL
jgi:pyridinium-3,5-biscarboxylic acid mononucleotide sulfurtransferase